MWLIPVAGADWQKQKSSLLLIVEGIDACYAEVSLGGGDSCFRLTMGYALNDRAIYSLLTRASFHATVNEPDFCDAYYDELFELGGVLY